MAWYEIEHSCGHTEMVQIYGTNAHGEREREAAWMASKPCRECQHKAERDRAEEVEAEVEMCELDGSPKQVTWARCIRAQMWDALGSQLAEMRERATDLDGFERDSDSVREWLRSQQDASWFIDHRGSSKDPLWLLADEVLRARKAAGK